MGPCGGAGDDLGAGTSPTTAHVTHAFVPSSIVGAGDPMPYSRSAVPPRVLLKGEGP